MAKSKQTNRPKSMQITHNRERPGGMHVIPGAMMLDLRLEELESPAEKRSLPHDSYGVRMTSIPCKGHKTKSENKLQRMKLEIHQSQTMERKFTINQRAFFFSLVHTDNF